MRNSRSDYVNEYYEKQLHRYGNALDDEIKTVGKFLLEEVSGKTLDFGCGPALHFWGFFMQHATQIDGIDITPENISFLQKYLSRISLDDYRGVEKYVQELSGDDSFTLVGQLKKIGAMHAGDFTSDMSGVARDYDTIVAPYSIGCVKTSAEYEKAVANMHRHLKPGGKALFIGTTGTSTCDVIPEYCYQGVQNDYDLVHDLFAKYFTNVDVQQIELEKDSTSLFPYTSLITAKGTA